MTAHKFLPGRTVALEALLDQLGVLLQRIISLETRYGDQFAPKVAWGQLRPATMERKLLSKSSLLFWPGRPTASEGILRGVSASTQGHLSVWPTSLPLSCRRLAWIKQEGPAVVLSQRRYNEQVSLAALYPITSHSKSYPRPRARISIHAGTLETEVLTFLASGSAIKERLVRKESLTAVFG
jgi:hypothetical protein